jgi:hypothetical protein
MTSNTLSTEPDQPDSNARLVEEVSPFAEQLMATLGGVLEREILFAVDVGLEAEKRHVIVQPEGGEPIVINIDGRPVFELVVRYLCVWNASKEYFAVDESEMTVSVVGVNESLFHFDYKREMGGSVPVAHVNVHANRDEIIYAMMLGTKKRARRRAKATDAGTVPRLSQLHIPVGGHRFRPSVEDVLEMLIHEFGIDAATDALPRLRAARAEYRTTQVRASVTDDPEAAAAVLRDLGYSVTFDGSTPRARPERLERY